MGTMVIFTRPDGKTVQGYLAEPTAPQSTSNAPAVVVIQEWWGLNDQIKGVADRLATAGYQALVPDLYRGKATVEAEEAHHLMTGLDFGDAASQDIRGAVQFLKARAPKVGLTGFCMGGALTLLGATQAPELDAAAVWYGCPPLDYIDASKIKAPLLGHWATQVLQDRCGRWPGSQAHRRWRGLRVPPLPGPPRLRQRNRRRPAPHSCNAVRPRVGSTSVGPYPALLRQATWVTRVWAVQRLWLASPELTPKFRYLL